ncbi:hypothetical protein CJU80_21675 [Pseudomonas fragi]|nr:hypothetical protein CJU80_21675 [Pseudomonas fragi]
MVELAQADQMPMDATQWCVYDMVSHNPVGAGLLAILAARFVWRNREMPSRAARSQILLQAFGLFFCRAFPHFKSRLCTCQILG